MPTAPVQLGEFELLSHLDQGGMGDVWLARNAGTGAPAAVKVLRASGRDEDRLRASLRREIRAVARLDHPHVVRVFDQGIVSAEASDRSEHELPAGSPWLAMELAPLGSLASRRDEVGASWGSIRSVLVALLRALAHAHANGLLHRDVKPGNLLAVGDRGSPRWKLADFGLNRATDPGLISQAGETNAGTPLYMAPEQLGGRADTQGPWTDLFAVGCIAFELLVGYPPAQGTNLATIALARLQGLLPAGVLRVDAPAAVRPWLERLLAVQPVQRFGHAADALASLPDGGELLPEGAAVTDHGAPESSGDWPETQATGPSTEGRMRFPCPVGGVPAPPDLQIPPSWRVAELDAAPSLHRPGGLGLLSLRHPPFAGRSALRDRLWQALLRVHDAGRAEVLELVGSPGVGRRRLARWVASRADELGAAQVLHLDLPAANEPREALARLALAALGHLPREDEPRRITALNALGLGDDRPLAAALRWLLDPSTTLTLPPPERRAAVARLLAALGERRLLVLVVDDPEGAAQVEGVLEALRSFERARVLVLRVGPSTSVHRIEVPPLDPQERALFFDGLGLASSLSKRLDDRLPGQLIEALASWAEAGQLEAGPGGIRATGPGPLPLDRGEPTLGRGWARLDAGERAALGLLACLGSEVDTDRFERACGAAGLSPDSLGRAALDSDLVSPSPGGWSLASGPTRAAILGALGELDPEGRLAGAAADALAEQGDAVGQRGRLLALARRPAEALAALLTAVELRLDRSEHDEAEQLLELADEQARALTQEPTHATRLLLLRARLEFGQGRFDDAGRRAMRAAALARRARDRPTEVRALRYRGMAAAKTGDLVGAETFLEQALARAQDPAEAARANMHLGTTRRLRGDLAGAVEALEASRQGFAALDDPFGRADALAELGHAWLTLADDTGRCAVLVSEALALYEQLGRGVGSAGCTNTLGDLAWRAGRRDEARARYTESLRALERAGSHQQVFPLFNLARLDLEDGRVDAARERLESGAATTSHRGWRLVEAYFRVALLVCHAQAARWEAWTEDLERARDLLDEADAVDAELADLADRAAAAARGAGQAERALEADHLAASQRALLTE